MKWVATRILLVIGMMVAVLSAAAQDEMVTITDPNTGVTYQVRARNAHEFESIGQRQYMPPGGVQAATPYAAPQNSGKLSFVTWNDPAEGAFSAAVPSGWQISGGTVRTTRIEPHYVIRAQSPDGGVQMFMDDPSIAIRQVPVQMGMGMGMGRGMGMAMGNREGQVIPSAWGGKLLVARYTPAPQLAQQYVRSRFCPSASQFSGGIIPGQTQSLNQEMGAIARSEGKQVRVDVGEISFKCGSQNGYVYAITVLASQPGAPISLWLVYRIGGYLATPQDNSIAADAMAAMLGTFEMNQAWLQSFARESQDMAGNVIRESNAVTQATIARAKEQDAAMAARNAAWQQNEQARFDAINHTNHAITNLGGGSGGANGHDVNVQLGTKEVCDDLDRCQQVDASVDSWYSDCSGQFYPGSSSGGPPPANTSACWNKGH